MIGEAQRRFLHAQRVARLASVDATVQPHVVPICYVLLEDTLYFSIDRKPKRAGNRPLKRIANMMQNPAVAVVVDRYEEDWQRLAWVMVQGRAEILERGIEHDRAQHELVRRYAQLEDMAIDDLPVVAIRIERVLSWGNLAG